MNYFVFCLFFTLAAFVNLLLAANGGELAVLPWWAHAILCIACTGAAIHAGYWERKTRRRHDYVPLFHPVSPYTNIGVEYCAKCGQSAPHEWHRR